MDVKVLELPQADYLALPAVSASMLKHLRKSPAHAKAWLAETKEPTDAQRFGTAFHMMMLEPERYSSVYRMFDGDRRTKVGKATWEDLHALGYLPLKPDEERALHGMRNTLRMHLEWRFITGQDINGFSVTDTVMEHSVLWTDPATSLPCKARPDVWRPTADYVADLKTVDDASPDAFATLVARNGWHYQACWYMRATGAERFVFLAVEVSAPYGVAAYEIGRDELSAIDWHIDHLLGEWAEAQTTETFTAYPDEVQPLRLPPWAFRETEGLI